MINSLIKNVNRKKTLVHANTELINR